MTAQTTCRRIRLLIWLWETFGENWSVRLTGLNLSDHRYLLDNSNTFGGTHYANPRELSVQLKYRFQY